MNIPDEAVEVAAKAIQDEALRALANPTVESNYGGEPYWNHIARTALEAAAPYIAAVAWEECADGYCEQLANLTLDWEELPNPYRSQA